jgi:RNA polymerase sigma factor (TIGR02999 family)
VFGLKTRRSQPGRWTISHGQPRDVANRVTCSNLYYLITFMAVNLASDQPIPRARMRDNSSVGARTHGEAAGSVPPAPSAMNDVTRILSDIEHGDRQTAEALLPLVYDELRMLAAQRLAQEKPGHTLQATALVHDAYLRLVGPEDAQRWVSRGHFFAAAAEAMRRILVNRIRDKRRLKRGGGWERVELNEAEIAHEGDRLDILALDEALDRLALEEPACAELVKLRFFAGLTQGESAQALGVTRRTADRYWAFARAWLLLALGGADEQLTGQ